MIGSWIMERQCRRRYIGASWCVITMLKLFDVCLTLIFFLLLINNHFVIFSTFLYMSGCVFTSRKILVPVTERNYRYYVFLGYHLPVTGIVISVLWTWFNPNIEKGQLAIVLMANFTLKKVSFNLDWKTISNGFPVN